jgi:hypothetical protein
MKNEIILTYNQLLESLQGDLKETKCTIATKSAPKNNKKSRITKELFESVFDRGVLCRTTRKVLIRE